MPQTSVSKPDLPQARARRAPRLASGGAIREAAASLFLQKGYQATSMDEIAAAAQVSKQTIYTHFAGKEELQADLVLGNAARVDEFIGDIAATVTTARDLKTGLRNLARRYVRFVIRPEVLRLRRLVIGEAGRFPELARAYYEQVPERVYAALANLFRDLDRGTGLEVADPELAAHQFAWLVLGMHLDRGMFVDSGAPIGDAELDRVANSAVEVFLAAYSA